MAKKPKKERAPDLHPVYSPFVKNPPPRLLSAIDFWHPIPGNKAGDLNTLAQID
jgi:hypothetical protein